MSSCLAPIVLMRPSLPDHHHHVQQLKRVRSSSLAAMAEPLKRVRSSSLAAMAEPLKSALKACKRLEGSSPRSSCEMIVVAATNDTKSTATRPAENAPWPTVAGCEGLRNALAFLQTSRQHAMVLMMQNHWDRAMSVLEKVENASESVYSHRRKLVLEQANRTYSSTTTTAGFSPSTPPPTLKQQRSVRFHDEVTVVQAAEMDRTASDIQSPVREEMLVLRASRAIPRSNLSELWE